jgi:hypothetical protein
MSRGFDPCFHESPPWVIDQFQPQPTEDLRFVVGVGVLHEHRDFGELFD